MAIDIRLYFDCASKKTYVKDLTNYNTEVPSGVTVIGLGSLLGPGNTSVFNLLSFNTPLIAANANPRVSAQFNLPTLIGGTSIAPGNYILDYNNYYTFTNNIANSQFINFSAENEIVIPNVNLTNLWAVGNAFTLSNCTTPANNGDYTIETISLSGSSTVITVSGTPFTTGEDNAALFTSSVEYTVVNQKTYTYTACATTVTPCVSANYDCTSTPYGNITFENTTAYPTGTVVDSSTFTIYYPNGLDFTQSPNPGYNDENPVIANNVSYVYIDTLATGTWSAKLALNTSQTQADGLVLTNSSSVVKEFNVSCTSNMCGLSSCLTKLKDRHISYLKSSTVSPLQQYVDNVQLLYTMAKEAQACGDKNTYEKYIAEIFAVVKQTDTDCGCGCSGSCSGSCDCGCDDGCGCGETGPTWVNNIGVNINSLLEDLAGIPAQVDAIQNTVDSLTDNVNLLNEWTGIENFDPEEPSLYSVVSTLESSLSGVETQVNTNTGDITGLQDQVNALDAEVTALQEQIADFSPSDSEISTYELMTNDGTKQSVWNATSGVAADSVNYTITIPGNVTSYFTSGTNVSFYNPTTQTWFYGEVEDSGFTAGSTVVGIIFSSATYTAGCSWQSSVIPFPVYVGDFNPSEYNFQYTLSLNNDSYWKFADDSHKYWSKIKASFVVNEPTVADVIDPFVINNNTSSQSIYLRDLPCGSIVELELSFEKQYNGTAYNTVTLIDVNYNASTNTALSETSELLFGGYSGFNPYFSYGISLNNTVSPEFQLSAIENKNTALTQDVYSSATGTQNNNRLISRYAKGPAYPNSIDPNFFTGSTNETIVLNSSNINITILSVEQSYGKMPVA